MPAVKNGTLTPGLTRALSQQKVHKMCDCGFPMPVYPGRYPSKCPLCQSARVKVDDGKSPAA